jgi:hypothetical protein
MTEEWEEDCSRDRTFLTLYLLSIIIMFPGQSFVCYA